MTNQVQSFEFFATCLPGAERLLADELHGLGVKKVRPLSGGASFFGAPEDALRVCLWSRLAGRVNLTVGRVAARDADALYAGVRELPWETVIADGASIAVRASGTNAELRNTQFVALKVKDAICDRLAETRGARPDVKPQQPDALVEVRLREEKAGLSLDLSGRSLTRRAYLGDEAGEEAPSVVSQAATLLAAVGAAELFAEGTTFLDPVDGGSILARVPRCPSACDQRRLGLAGRRRCRGRGCPSRVRGRFPRGASRLPFRLRRLRGHGCEVQGGTDGAPQAGPRPFRDDSRGVR